MSEPTIGRHYPHGDCDGSPLGGEQPSAHGEPPQQITLPAFVAGLLLRMISVIVRHATFITVLAAWTVVGAVSAHVLLWTVVGAVSAHVLLWTARFGWGLVG